MSRMISEITRTACESDEFVTSSDDDESATEVTNANNTALTYGSLAKPNKKSRSKKTRFKK